jgi:hypothetical protein
MALKPPLRPEDIYDQLTADLKAVLGEDLLGLGVYGSAAQGRYRPGVSDINLLVLLTDASHHRLKELLPFCQKWTPAKVAPPLVLTPEFLRTSQDVFPVEFLVMAAGHRHLFGQDALASPPPEPRMLRLQLEREFRAKLMALRSRLLAGGGREPELRGLVREALPAFTALFQALLYLRGGSFPLEPAMVMAAMGEAGFGVAAFLGLRQAAEASAKTAAGHWLTLWERALGELEAMITFIDQLDANQGA